MGLSADLWPLTSTNRRLNRGEPGRPIVAVRACPDSEQEPRAKSIIHNSFQTSLWMGASTFSFLSGSTPEDNSSHSSHKPADLHFLFHNRIPSRHISLILSSSYITFHSGGGSFPFPNHDSNLISNEAMRHMRIIKAAKLERL